MIGLGLGSQHQFQNRSAAWIINAIAAPFVPIAFPGQTLADVENWDVITQAANYQTEAMGASILSVELAFSGTVSSETQILVDGDIVAVSITVTDTAGNVRSFVLNQRVILYASPSLAGSADLNLTLSSGEVVAGIDLAPNFVGEGLSYSVLPGSDGLPSGLSLSIDGVISGTPDQGGSSSTLVVRAENSGGFVDLQLHVTVDAPSAVVIQSVGVGQVSAGVLPITVTATGAVPGDQVYWTLQPAADPAPSASEVASAMASGGGTPTSSGSVLWPSMLNDTLSATIPNGDYRVYVCIDNGSLSLVAASDIFSLSLVEPVLTGPMAAETGGDIAWSVMTDQASGIIYAALRPASAVTLSADEIIQTTGEALVTTIDNTVLADASNGGTFAAPGDGDYVVDIVHQNADGVTSAVVSSSVVSIGPSQTVTYISDSDTHANTGSPVMVDLSAVTADEWLLVGLTQASGGGSGLAFETLMIEGAPAALIPGASFVDGVRKVAMFRIQCPPAVAGTAAVQLTANLETGDTSGRYNAFVYRAAVEPVPVQIETDRNTSMDVTLTSTGAGHPVVVFAAAASSLLTLTGVTEDGTAVTFSGRKHACGSHENSAGGIRMITVQSNTGNAVAMSAEIGA